MDGNCGLELRNRRDAITFASGFLAESSSGVKGTVLALGLAAQARTIPEQRARSLYGPASPCLTPRQHFRPSAHKRKNFRRRQVQAAQKPLPDVFGKEKGVQ